MNQQPPVNPEFYDQPDLRRVLAERNIGALYRALTDAGISQRRISVLTGQSQSEVSEILKGRVVMAYDVLARIADGLAIPREFMGLSYGDDGAYSGEVTDTEAAEGAEEEMRRRGLLAAGAAAAVGWPLLGEPPTLTAPTGEPLPPRLTGAHIDAVADLLARLRTWARAHGGQADVIGAAANRSLRLLTIPGSDALHARLGSVLAELHTEAAWTYFDSAADDAARYYFSRAFDLAHRSGDRYQVANALRHAGMLPLERDQLDDALKLFQLGEVTFTLGDATREHARKARFMSSCLDSSQARVFARTGQADSARTKLAAARDGWEPPDAFAQADADYRNAEVSLQLGQIDTAEQFITTSAQTWGKHDRRPAASTAILRATIHVQAGEPSGLPLAHTAITAASVLDSARVRQRLEPLAEALNSRPSSDAKDLARQARQVATTRS